MKWIVVGVVLFFSTFVQAKPLTEKDYILLALAVFHESRGEPSHGQQAIVEVVLNRTSSTKSVKDVILAPYQFSFTLVFGWFAIPHKDVVEFVGLVKRYEKNIKNGNRVLPKGTKYFHNNLTNPRWASKMLKAASIGGHHFYKEI